MPDIMIECPILRRPVTVYAGDLLIGFLTEQARVPYVGQWTWALSGTRPNPPGFIWIGIERTLDKARAAHEASWLAWLCGRPPRERDFQRQ